MGPNVSSRMRGVSSAASLTTVGVKASERLGRRAAGEDLGPRGDRGVEVATDDVALPRGGEHRGVDAGLELLRQLDEAGTSLSATAFSTYTRSIEAQFCPALVNAPQTRPRAVRSRVAVAQDDGGVLAAQLERAGDELLGTGHRDAPAGGDAAGEDHQIDVRAHERGAASPPPCTIWSTPSGIGPSKSDATSAPERAATSLGLHTTALPASSAGMSVRSGMATG